MTRPPQLRVLVVEAQPAMREGLRVNIDAEPDLTVVAEAWDREGAMRETSSHGPDVILLDLSLVDVHGERLVRHLLERSRGSRVIVLSSLEEEDLIRAALEAGAALHLRKDAFREELLGSIRTVGRGASRPSPATERSAASETERADPLSEREIAILQLIARGMSDAGIAAALGDSETVVGADIARILSKTGASKRVQAAIRALERGTLRL